MHILRFKSLKPSDGKGTDEAFTPSTHARLVNALWFVTLVLCLCVSLLSILAMQWLDEFHSRMRRPVPSAHHLAMRHHVLRGGLDKWRLGAFISALPFLLHTATFLFFIGVVVLLHEVDKLIASVVATLVGVAYLFYITATLLPLWHGESPTVTPLLYLIHGLLFYIGAVAQRQA
jgi:hypothetical protein